MRKRVTSQLNIGEEETTTNMKMINREIERFYSELLTTKLSQNQQASFDDNFNDFAHNLEMP